MDWINGAAKVFLPTGYGDRSAQCITFHDDGQLHVQVAAPETLLAMKLHAPQRRGNHGAPDLAVLLPHCKITAAEQLYEAYYSGDSLTLRTVQLLEQILSRSTEPPAALYPTLS